MKKIHFRLIWQIVDSSPGWEMKPYRNPHGNIHFYIVDHTVSSYVMLYLIQIKIEVLAGYYYAYFVDEELGT